jgi:uncharacterized membrane protein
MNRLFDQEQESRVIQAIQEAERQTSGEIRVHIDNRHSGDVMKIAKQAFHRLGMDRTTARNGVLIFILPNMKAFAILGDEGIDRVVPDDFWSSERDIMEKYFRKEDFADGVCEVVQQIGEKLKEHFPYDEETDENELPDDISYQ